MSFRLRIFSLDPRLYFYSGRIGAWRGTSRPSLMIFPAVGNRRYCSLQNSIRNDASWQYRAQKKSRIDVSKERPQAQR